MFRCYGDEVNADRAVILLMQDRRRFGAIAPAPTDARWHPTKRVAVRERDPGAIQNASRRK